MTDVIGGAAFNEALETAKKAKNKKYDDPDFRPNNDHLCADAKAYKEFFYRFTWKRLADVYKKKKPVIFDSKIEPADIQQGALGDCYFLSALSVMAEKPDRIRKLFLSDEINEAGVYGVRITKNGIYQEVVLDDHVPVYKDKPAFSNTKGVELWVVLLEKAWAKVHGSYERIEAGQAHLTMRDLTGAPAYEYFIENTPGMFDLILAADKKDYIITSGCNADNEAEVAKLKAKGLVGEHSYGIIKAARVIDKEGKTVDLCQLRNPWGNFEWTGRWSDNSTEWTEDLRKELGVVSADDGLFWMDFEDLNDFFPRVQICKYEDSFKFSHCKQKGTYGCFTFNVAEEGMYTFSVSQFGERMVPRGEKYYYSDVRFFLLKLGQGDDAKPDNKDKVKYIDAKKSYYERDLYIECEKLAEVNYCIVCEVDWVEDSRQADRTYAITCYGQSEVDIKDSSMEFTRADVIRATLSSMLRDGTVQALTQGLPGNEAPGVEITEFRTDFAYAMYRIENKEAELSYVETAEFLKLDKVKLLGPENGSKYQIKVNPGETRDIVVRFGCNGFNIQKTYSYILVKSDEALYTQCLEDGQRQERGAGIALHILQHQAGVLMVY